MGDALIESRRGRYNRSLTHCRRRCPTGSAAEPEPPWEPWPACQLQVPAQWPKLPAPPQPTTQLSSLNLPLLIRPAGGFGRSPSACLAADPEKSPVYDPVPRRLACIAVNLDP